MWKQRLSKLGFYISYWIAYAVVSLRYRIEVVGLEKLKEKGFARPGGILFLPNHSAEIDPVLLEVALWREFRPRPLIIEHFYKLKGFKVFLDLAKVLPIPSMDTAASKWRGKKIEKQFHVIVDLLKKKENFLIYPSGRLKQSGFEIVGGASFVHRLLETCPEANVVLVRTTGLWGSMFSRALTGSSPDFGKAVWEGIKILLKNGFFFVPKRHVKVELELPASDFPWNATRLKLNRYLENWYNCYPEKGAEPLKLVSYACWKSELPKVMERKEGTTEIEQRPVNSAIQQEIFKELSTLAGQPVEKIERSMHLARDLGLDSLDIAQLYVFLDERYEVSDLAPGDLHSVEDLLQAAAGYKKEREEEASRVKVSRYWPKEKERYAPVIPPGDTIHEVFFKSCERDADLIASTDLLTGPKTYRALKRAALVLSEIFRTLPGDKIGVLLPSSTSAYLTVLAILYAKKTPVMLNWTAGVRSLNHACDLTRLSTVISSDRFLDRLDSGDLGRAEEKLFLLEDVRGRITWKDKIRGLWRSFQKGERLMKTLGLTEIQSTDPAVILFTSGTETLPKGVPLSHENILSDLRSSMGAAEIQLNDVLYSVLPPFHSFGLVVSGLLPLLGGFKVCFGANPNDSHSMALDIAGWNPTLLYCAPSFIRALFRIARPEQLQSLRFIVSGAEKTPQELFDYIAEHLPKSQLLEGYGVTECSPIVSFDRPGRAHKGVGLPIPGVDIKIIDTETQAKLTPGQEGEVCIAGPSVFAGYLGGTPDPFLLVEGKRYYRSGDRGFIDSDGSLILAGRMKRFVKIGGEMVSLAGLEEELLHIAHEKKWVVEEQEGPPLAISIKEKENEKPIIVLFTTFSISKEAINDLLKEYGYGRIVKIGDVRKVDHIPLTGTGKTHYRLLDEL